MSLSTINLHLQFKFVFNIKYTYFPDIEVVQNIIVTFFFKEYNVTHKQCKFIYLFIYNLEKWLNFNTIQLLLFLTRV